MGGLWNSDLVRGCWIISEDGPTGERIEGDCPRMTPPGLSTVQKKKAPNRGSGKPE